MRGKQAIYLLLAIVPASVPCVLVDAQERSANSNSREGAIDPVRSNDTSHLEALVTGDAQHLGNAVAGYGATLKFYFTPRPPLPGTEPSLAYPSGWNITGQKLTVSNGGFTSAWITQIEGWDADHNGSPLLRAFQDKIDANGFKGENASPPNPGCDLVYPSSSLVSCQNQSTCVGGPNNGNACTNQSNCPKSCAGGIHPGESCTFDFNCPGGRCEGACVKPCSILLGEPGPTCGGAVAGYCDWGWQNICGADVSCLPPHRSDWVMASNQLVNQTPAANIVSATGPNFAASTTSGTEIFDGGIRYYTGTLILPVPACARGTYTIAHKIDESFAEPGFLGGTFPVAAYMTGVLQIPIGSCCTNFTSPSNATCTPDLLVGDCNALAGNSFHIFRANADCSTPCEVECVTAADCDDHRFCTVDSCTPDGHCEHTHSDEICDDSVGCTTDICVTASDSCIHTTVDAVCDDGLYCNGAEFCISSGCQPGDPPCGFDETCDETNDSCGLTPIPTVSQWGLAVFTLFILIVAKIGFHRAKGSVGP